jgi:hypothetical protein
MIWSKKPKIGEKQEEERKRKRDWYQLVTFQSIRFSSPHSGKKVVGNSEGTVG